MWGGVTFFGAASDLHDEIRGARGGKIDKARDKSRRDAAQRAQVILAQGKTASADAALGGTRRSEGQAESLHHSSRKPVRMKQAYSLRLLLVRRPQGDALG